MQESICRVIIDSDGEIDAGFSCLLEEKGGGKEKGMWNLKKNLFLPGTAPAHFFLEWMFNPHLNTSIFYKGLPQISGISSL